jgi:hypothetical protein
MHENRDTTEFPAQSLIRTFTCEPACNVPGLGLRPTWFENAEIIHNAAEALELVLERPLQAGAGLTGEIEAAGAMVHLRLEDGWRRNAQDELAWRFQCVLHRHILGRASLPTSGSGRFVTVSAQRLIQRAASEAVARVLDELDDVYKERLAQVRWRELAPCLEEHATHGYARAVQRFEKSVFPLFRPASFTQAARDLQAGLHDRYASETRLVVRVQLLDGVTAFESFVGRDVRSQQYAEATA